MLSSMHTLTYSALAYLVVPCLALMTRPADELNGKRSLLNETFDYIIVGGGTAGLVLAERLSENSSISVAVIEAGAQYQVTSPLLATLPAGDAVFIGADPLDTNPLVDWGFVTQPQAGANGRQLHYARGLCLGGSSALNLMVYQRPTAGSLNKWATEVGDDSYAWDSFLPYYKRSVKFYPPESPPRAANATPSYNVDAFQTGAGPLSVSYPNFAAPWSSWVQRGLNAIGLANATDFNSGELMGVQYVSTTINPGSETRDSSQTSFLNFASGRSNLHVFTLTLAKQIVFDSSKRATGVVISTDGAISTLSARREVILSAGAFQSPQLLMVSGIGPAATMQALGIPVVHDLPGVGQNMQDHVFFGPSFRVNVDTFTGLANDPVDLAAQLAVYSLTKGGPVANPGADLLGWEKIPSALRAGFSPSARRDLATLPADWPEIEYLSTPVFYGNFSNPFLLQPKDGYQYAGISAAVVAPLSRGNVTIVSSDAAVKPLVNPNWLTSPTDQQVAVAGYKRVRQALASSAIAPVLIGPEYYPGEAAVATDAQVLDSIRENMMTVWHASCTCRMGNASDPMAVVDSKARVFGVTGLRVVDASSFPFLPPGHPQSTVYALAEKIAADILGGL